MSFFITGLLVGIVSLIPGISGGTVILLRNQYEEISNAISNLRKNKQRVFFLLLGVILGALFFAKIAEFLFTYIPTETMILFLGFLLFSTPPIIKQEKDNLNFLGIIIGMAIIFLIFIAIPESPKIITQYPKLTIPFLILFSLSGALDGFITILPGISGSMVMMLLGPYYLYKSYMANLSFANIIFLLPLTLYFLFDMLGIFIGSKLSVFLLNKHHKITMSIIIGFVVMSMFIIIPFSEINTFNKVLTCTMSLTISYIIIETINHISTKN